MADDEKCPFRILDVTAANPEARADPYPRLAELRALCPLHRDEAGGAWLVPRMADARAVFTDNSHTKNPDTAEPGAHAVRRRRATVPEGLDFPDDQRSSLLELDGEEHSRIRRPLVQALYERIARFEPECIRIVDDALDRQEGRRGEFDLMREIAHPVPVACIGAILGVPEEKLSSFQTWMDGIIQTFNPIRTPEDVASLVASANGLAHFVRETFAARKLDPRDDLFSDMAKAQAEGAPLSDVDITFNLRGVLIAGNITTTDVIGNAVRLIITHPEQRAKLAADPALWPNAVEETLRYEAPVDFTWRIASRDMELSGCPVNKGAALSVFMRSANRDEAAFPRADEFDVSRKGAARHLAFGGGAHICPGAPLARMEARHLLQRLFTRFPNLRLADPAAPVDWRKIPGFRGLERLGVRID
ncbi:MAG: cytochrome P450 [Hyphomonadaceae bacterium]|nr:cytochrome P450 [Hyphomonadaceae bacterium]